MQKRSRRDSRRRRTDDAVVRNESDSGKAIADISDQQQEKHKAHRYSARHEDTPLAADWDTEGLEQGKDALHAAALEMDNEIQECQSEEWHYLRIADNGTVIYWGNPNPVGRTIDGVNVESAESPLFVLIKEGRLTFLIPALIKKHKWQAKSGLSVVAFGQHNPPPRYSWGAINEYNAVDEITLAAEQYARAVIAANAFGSPPPNLPRIQHDDVPDGKGARQIAMRQLEIWE